MASTKKTDKPRHRCETLNLDMGKLDEESLTKRVQINVLDNFPNHLHPRGDIANAFKLNVQMVEPLDYIDRSRKDFWLVNDETTLQEMSWILLDRSTISVSLKLDTEFSYHDITSLIMISCDKFDFVVDAIALHSKIKFYLGTVFSRTNILKLVFGTDTLLSLQRDFDVFSCSVLDLQNVHYKFEELQVNPTFEMFIKCYLNKTLNTTNESFWFRLRPLPRDILEYARDYSKLLLFSWESIKEKKPDLLLHKIDYAHHKYWMLRVFMFPQKKNVNDGWFDTLKTLSAEQQKLFLREKYFTLYEKLWNWRENTAKLKDLRPYRVISDYDMAYFCVMKPKNVKILNCIWKYSDSYDIHCKDNLIGMIQEYAETSSEIPLENVTFTIQNTLDVENLLTESQTDAQSTDPIAFEKMEVDIVNNSNNQVSNQIVTFVPPIACNPFDNVLSVNEVSKSDLLNHFHLIRNSKMPKRIVNRLRRMRSRIRHAKINEVRVKNNLPPIVFKD